MTIEKKKLEKIILNYMESHNTVSLATERDRIPHAATVFYINRGYKLFFLSSPSSRHGENMSNNPRVSATINEDYDSWMSIKGIQLEGLVKEIGGILKNRQIAKAYVKKYPGVEDFLFSPQNLDSVIAKRISKIRFYRLEPSRIYFLNNEWGFGQGEELELFS